LVQTISGPRWLFRRISEHRLRFPSPQAASLADLKWFEVFHDEALQSLIRVALEQNYDLRDAVTRVEQARANLGIAGSNQLPQMDASGSFNVTRSSRNGAIALPASIPFAQERNYGQAGLNLLSFELDLWGRLLRATEEARGVWCCVRGAF
jgi:multidrug efflux system outer membrane protein